MKKVIWFCGNCGSKDVWEDGPMVNPNTGETRPDGSSPDNYCFTCNNENILCSGTEDERLEVVQENLEDGSMLPSGEMR